MDQLLQIAGALMVLAAFAGAQFGVLSPRSYQGFFILGRGTAGSTGHSRQ